MIAVVVEGKQKEEFDTFTATISADLLLKSQAMERRRALWIGAWVEKS